MSGSTGINGKSGRLWLLVLALAVGAVLAVYAQTGSFGLSGYDDQIVLRTNSDAPRGISLQSMKRIFKPAGMATYQPLRDLAVETVYEFSGTDPSGYHWFNVLLYAFNLAAVFWLLRVLLPLGGEIWPGGARLWASLGTALFAVHPVHVEAVAWINGNKEMLSGLFYFLGLGFYIRARGSGVLSISYLAGFVCFVLGMLSKPSVAAFPLTVAALEMIWPERSKRISGRMAARLLPYLLPTVLAGLYFSLRTTAAMDSWLQDSMLTHMLSMASVLGHYLITMTIPVNLCHSYPPPVFFRRLRLAPDILSGSGFCTAWRNLDRG